MNPTPEVKVVGTGFYKNAAPGSFGPSEWLDLLMVCQDGLATCMRVMEIIERETIPAKCVQALQEKALALCHIIESLPASPQQTDMSIQASAIHQEMQRLLLHDQSVSGAQKGQAL